MQPLQLATDAMGRKSHILIPSDAVWVVSLVSGVARQVTPPAGARFVLFNATGPFWARIGGAAVLPTPGVDISDGTAPELAPTARALNGNGPIGLVSGNDTLVNLVFYR